MPAERIHRIEVLPQQHEFLADTTSRELLFSAAFGAGKTRALCLRRMVRAFRPGAREALVRKHLVTLIATTLRTLLEPDGDLPPVLPPGTYTHNQTKKIISLHGGGEIVYFGLDEPQKTGSHNLTGIGVDEAVELTESDWTWLRGRLRGKVEGLNRSLDAACNPGAPTHFLTKRFGLVPGTKAQRGCRVIRAKSTDNIFLPPDYLDDLASFTGLAKRRFVDGEWAGSDGLVYDAFSESLMVRARPRDSFPRYVAGLDAGYVNPTALIVAGVDGDGRLHIPYEWYERKMRKEQIVQVAQEAYRRFGFEYVACDPSAAELIDDLYAAGIPAVAADNAVFAGIMQVQKYVRVAGDDRSRITIDPSCANLIRELQTYEWMRSKSGDFTDKPVKVNDHACDALRYLINELERAPIAGVW